MNLFVFSIPEWVFVALSFAILLFALTKLLWNPVNKVLDARQGRIAKSLADAELITSEKKTLDERLASLEDDLDQRTKQMMKEARTRAGQEYDRIVAEAESKAKEIMMAARVQAERDRDGLIKDAKAEIISTALQAAGVLLESKVDGPENERLILSFLNKKDASA